MAPTIICCAVTGSITTLAQHPGLPCTPKQIADAAIESAKAGAAVVHIHVREADGKPSMRLDLYRDVVNRIRDSATDVVINLTTGPGQRFVPGRPDPGRPDPSTSLTTPEKRVEHVVALRPELCTLDMQTMLMGQSVIVNIPWSVREMAAQIQAAGTKPELTCFDEGSLRFTNALVAEGLFSGVPYYQLVLGADYGAGASVQTTCHLSAMIPKGATWSVIGIGRHQFPVVAQAVLLGGHSRVGMEDNIYLARGKKTPDNAALVAKAARIVEELGSECATAEQARTMLGLRKLEPV